MIILTKEQRDYIIGYYGNFNAINPTQLNKTEYYLPEAILSNAECRDAWDYLKVLPTRLLTADDIIEVENPNSIQDKVNYLHKFDFGTFNGYDLKVGIVRTGAWLENKLTVYVDILMYQVEELKDIKRITLSVDNEFSVEGVGVFDLFMMQIKAGGSIFGITEQLMSARMDYILENKL